MASSESVENELLSFLSKSSSNSEARDLAIQYILGLPGSEEGRQFICRNEKYLTAIIELLDDEVETVASYAYRSVANLATDEQLSRKMLNSDDVAKNIIKCCFSVEKARADTACITLANLSHWRECAFLITSFLEGCDEQISIYRIVEVFCKVTDRLHYLASFLCNLTQIKDARKLILDKNKCIFQKLLPFISFKESRVRQNGVVGILRNCCFEKEYHDWLLSEKVDILPRLLLPLAGPEEFDEDDMEKLPVDLQYLEANKKREPDADVRRMLIETVNQLCATQKCREIIKSKNVYVIFRELHKWEEDAACIVAIENLICVLISDEPEEGINLNEVEIPKDIEQKLTKMHIVK